MRSKTRTGGLITGVSLIFWLVFLRFTDVSGSWEWRGPVETAIGRAVAVGETSVFLGTLRRARVEFEHGPQRGVSYAMHTTAAVGDRVAIEYPQGRADRGRVVGMHRAPFPTWFLAGPALLTLLGIGVLVSGRARGGG
jgi:hypothetical protein